MNAAPEKNLTVAPVLPRSAMVFTCGYVAGSHMIICGFLLCPFSTATGRELRRLLNCFVGVNEAHRQTRIGVELGGDGLEPDRRAAGTHLDPHSSVDTAVRDERSRSDGALGIHRQIRPEELIDVAGLGLGVPVRLDRDRCRTHARQRSRRNDEACRCRCEGHGCRRRRRDELARSWRVRSMWQVQPAQVMSRSC